MAAGSTPTFAVDTSCMIAAVCDWHEHHTNARLAIDKRISAGERRAIAAHALLEAYAVLTRLPAPHRLAPTDAWTLLEANFVTGCQVIGISGRQCASTIRQLAARDIAGGRAYDAVIGDCARRSGASTLLTFNGRHFDPPPRGVAIVVP